MYRSFVTCDDPKGVVECGTIRKSKVASMKIEEKPRNRRDKPSKREEMARSSDSQNRVEENYRSPSSSFQLIEVSRGAQKLNQLIDTWSKGLTNESNREKSTDVAKELLKGALDLQDSLTMLSKLQEASHYVSKLKKKKQKDKVEREGFDDIDEELRNAIRDGFARQNLLRSFPARRSIDSGSCVPSSSSSNSIDSLMSQKGLPKKGKAPNLIAKLMGLEEIPLEPIPHRRPKFDVQMDKMVNSQRRTTLEEILETTQSRGLLREHKPKEFCSCRKSVDDVHPIVLIKPLRVPCFDPEQALGPIVRGDGGIDTKMMLKRMRIKQIHDSEVTSKMKFEREQVEIPIERIIREEGDQDRIKVDLNPISQRFERARRHSNEERAKEYKQESKRKEEREGKKKRRDSSPSKGDGSNMAARKQLKDEITDKKVGEVQKVVITSSRKPVEKESLKTKIVSKSGEKANLTLTKVRKPENGSITTEKHASQQRKNDAKHTTQKEKPARDNAAAIPVPEVVECKEEEKRIDVTCEIISDKKEPSIEEEEKVSFFRVEDQCCQSQSSVCSTTKSEHEMTMISIDDKSYKSEKRLKTLLLNSPKLANLAEDLSKDDKISYDYLEEYMERRSLLDSQAMHPMLLSMGSSRIPISLDRLVEEIRGGIETLESYRKDGFDEFRADSLYGILDRDVRCRGVVVGVWDLGWRHGFSVDEIEEVVKDLEVLVVSELIEEVFY